MHLSQGGKMKGLAATLFKMKLDQSDYTSCTSTSSSSPCEHIGESAAGPPSDRWSPILIFQQLWLEISRWPSSQFLQIKTNNPQIRQDGAKAQVSRAEAPAKDGLYHLQAGQRPPRQGSCSPVQHPKAGRLPKIQSHLRRMYPPSLLAAALHLSLQQKKKKKNLAC